MRWPMKHLRPLKSWAKVIILGIYNLNPLGLNFKAPKFEVENKNQQRTCLGCRQKKNQSHLWRVISCKNSDGSMSIKWDIERKKGGRGAWLCAHSQPCLNMALKKKAFQAAFKVKNIANFLSLPHN
ncbi:MAG: YlxR family protein [Candidatus Adiutrix sp.]